MDNKRAALIIAFVVVILLLAIAVFGGKPKIVDKSTVLEKTSGITVVPTMNDKITEDSIWSGSFELAWNEMKEEEVGRRYKI